MAFLVNLGLESKNNIGVAAMPLRQSWCCSSVFLVAVTAIPLLRRLTLFDSLSDQNWWSCVLGLFTVELLSHQNLDVFDRWGSYWSLGFVGLFLVMMTLFLLRRIWLVFCRNMIRRNGIMLGIILRVMSRMRSILLIWHWEVVDLHLVLL